MAQPTRHLRPVANDASTDTENDTATAQTLSPTRMIAGGDGGAPSRASALAATTTALLRAGVRRHARLAADWVADPRVEPHARLAAEARQVRARAAAERHLAKARSDAQKADAHNAVARAQSSAPGEIEVTARTAAMRTYRALVCAGLPTGATAGPVYLAFAHGEWVTLLAWPGLAAYLLVHEWAARRNSEHTPTSGSATYAPPEPQVSTGAPASAAPTAILGASSEENRILARLEQWDTHAQKRGLAGVNRSDVRLDSSGIVVVLTTSGRITPADLPKKVASVRAVLGVPTDTPMEITPGEVGDQALVRIRTRRLQVDTTWSPQCAGIGVDTDTGEVVALPTGRKLIAGTSGSGKSVAVRVIMAEALTSAEPTAVVYIDGKGEESSLWVGKVRIAVEPEEISALVHELVAEGHRRRDHMRQRQVSTWTPTADDPRLVVVVDEGAEVMAMDSKKTPMLAGLRTIARTGRSRCIDLVWATQKPTIGDGIDSQINGVMEIRAVLRTAGDTETRQVLGPGWPNHTWTGAGQCVVKGTGRDETQAPIHGWDLSADATVRALPKGRQWHYSGPTDQDEPEDVLSAARRLCGDESGVHTETLKRELGIDELEIHTELTALGVYPERNAFWVGSRKGRGYRREALVTHDE